MTDQSPTDAALVWPIKRSFIDYVERMPDGAVDGNVNDRGRFSAVHSG